MKKKFLKKGDYIIFAAILFSAAAVFLCLNFFNADTGAAAKITLNGQTVAVLRLNEDTVYNVKINGEISNTVEIKNGFADVTYADCADKICVNHKKINKTGESIICLPNKVIITVVDSSDNIEIDGVAR
ncbi:MAG: NusG domain II-containing protein [Clostridiales bacterium]|nr:NusG domain II-containing protein [Clostridiales bacterium]